MTYDPICKCCRSRPVMDRCDCCEECWYSGRYAEWQAGKRARRTELTLLDSISQPFRGAASQETER